MMTDLSQIDVKAYSSRQLRQLVPALDRLAQAFHSVARPHLGRTHRDAARRMQDELRSRAKRKW